MKVIYIPTSNYYLFPIIIIIVIIFVIIVIIIILLLLLLILLSLLLLLLLLSLFTFVIVIVFISPPEQAFFKIRVPIQVGNLIAHSMYLLDYLKNGEKILTIITQCP